MTQKNYPSDISDQQWQIIEPSLILMTQDAPQRSYKLRNIFNGLAWLVRSGATWRMLPKDFAPWQTVYQQYRRWLHSGCLETAVHQLRLLVRVALGKKPQPTAAILDARTIKSTPESGARAGVDGYKKIKGSKTHLAVDTLGLLLALFITPANDPERDQVAPLTEAIQNETQKSVKVAFVDEGYTGIYPEQAAQKSGIKLQVVKHPDGKKGFRILPKRWIVERSFAWLSRFRRLARDYERLPEVLRGFHFMAFILLMLPKAIPMLKSS